ncbi:MAG: hypothetical protein WCW30_01320, partial [Candidatus Gracilibacteria bacterium]
MKKFYLFMMIFLTILLLIGCTTNPQPTEEISKTTSETTVKTEDANVDFPPEPTAEILPSWEENIPDNIEELQTIEVDLEGDGSPEVAVMYKDPDVMAHEGDIHEIYYLKIYQNTDNQWIEIKGDEVTAKGGAVDEEFCTFEAVNLGNDNKEELLVGKCDFKGTRLGYYIFGQTSEGQLEDLPIPKGYLHEEEILKPGDEFMDLDTMEITKEGIEETYFIACESRNWYAGRFGDQSGGFCREITWFIPYTGGVFGAPTIQEDTNLITTESYEVPSEGVVYTFDLPIWLTPSNIYKTSHISLTDELNEYRLRFELYTQDISLPPNLELETSSLTKDELLNGFCEEWMSDYENSPGKEVTCTVSDNKAIAKETDYLYMLKLFDETEELVRFSLYLKDE